MQDKQLYQQILGIESPWVVSEVDLRLDEGEVRVRLSHKRMLKWPCPECGEPCSLYDHQEERGWRHLDTCQFKTILLARPPRCDCPEHGVRSVALPWAQSHSRFTALFEALTIDWLQAACQSAVADLLGLSWDEVHAIMSRAVKRGLTRRKAEPLRYLGVDEKSFKKGHKYVTLVCDLDESRVLFVEDDRKQSSLDTFWETLTDEQLHGIKAVAMDMWDPYVNSVKEHLPDGKNKIVFDKFHIAGHLGKAVNDVRKRENKELKHLGDKTLVGTKYKWLRNPDNFERQAWREFKGLRESNLKTARAWAIKEQAMDLFLYRHDGWARRFFKSWYFWATHSRLEPMIKVAQMMKGRLDNILTYLKYPITNAVSESINSKVQWIKYSARGFRNRENFKLAIYFHCGKLALYP